jgi:hypothetical protein
MFLSQLGDWITFYQIALLAYERQLCATSGRSLEVSLDPKAAKLSNWRAIAVEY